MLKITLKYEMYFCADIKHKSLFGLSRLLKEMGHEDQPMEIYRDDKLSMSIKSLFWAATKTVREEPFLAIRDWMPLEYKFKEKTASVEKV